ncbi:MAG TPA: tRNA epoxyqueuosine(34) reductase QueG [Gemmatimonadaceae bacterium]|nr:tRNA epoxyqueuosine(34) reductase QueG [Gemmatimonadaceae bacterium]
MHGEGPGTRANARADLRAGLEQRLRAQAYGLGFDLVGLTRLGPADTRAAFERWLDAGYAGDMHYLERWRALRRDTRLPFEGVTSAVVVGMNYGGTEPPGPVARYARGDDYHELMRGRLRELLAWLERETGAPVRGRPYVDTGPILERDLARQAGLGWFGKNTMLINPGLGSFFFLGALFTDLALTPDEPFETEHCGTCRRCLDACPTGALVAPGEMDARRCISYLTIEHRGPIAEELREKIGGLVYGCDICQDVCPWNEKFSQAVTERAYEARSHLAAKDPRSIARDLLHMDDAAYRARFRGSAMTRAKLSGLKRNAVVVLGNVGTVDDFDVLTRALDDPEPLVSEHAAWALACIAARGARATGDHRV